MDVETHALKQLLPGKADNQGMLRHIKPRNFAGMPGQGYILVITVKGQGVIWLIGHTTSYASRTDRFLAIDKWSPGRSHGSISGKNISYARQHFTPMNGTASGTYRFRGNHMAESSRMNTKINQQIGPQQAPVTQLKSLLLLRLKVRDLPADEPAGIQTACQQGCHESMI